MRVVADTNTVVSGTLWHGNPRRILDAARDDLIELFTSKALLAELQNVLRRGKFAERLLLSNHTAHEVVRNYAYLATVIHVEETERVVIRDPDDDAVIACAKASHSDFIVSGDNDLLDLGEHQGIRILDPTDFLSDLGL